MRNQGESLKGLVPLESAGRGLESVGHRTPFLKALLPWDNFKRPPVPLCSSPIFCVLCRRCVPTDRLSVGLMKRARAGEGDWI